MKLEPSITRDETRDAVKWFFGIHSEEELNDKLRRISAAQLDEVMNAYYDEIGQ
jgi:hypothetical protein